MRKQHTGTSLLCLLCRLLPVASLLLLCGFSGYIKTAHQSASPKGTYNVEVTLQGGPSERYSQWLMDVSRNGAALLSDYKIRPFYALSCVNNGKARWLSDSVLHFFSYGACQGRGVTVSIRNTTDKAIPLTEVWIRSVDPKGYSHCPGICLFFDIPTGSSCMINPGALVFAGGEYFSVGCEQDRGKSALSRFKIPKPVSRSSPYIPFWRHHVTINLTHAGPVIDGVGKLEALTESEAKALVPVEVQLPLIEERRGRVKKDTEHYKSDSDAGK